MLTVLLILCRSWVLHAAEQHGDAGVFRRIYWKLMWLTVPWDIGSATMLRWAVDFIMPA